MKTTSSASLRSVRVSRPLRRLSPVLFLFRVLLGSMLAFASTAWGTSLLIEDFNYPAGQLLTANGWTASSGAGTNAITVTAPGLTYSGYASSGVGNAVSLTTSGEDDGRSFATTTTGSVYAAAMVTVSAAQTGGDYFFHFTSGSSFFARLYVKKDSASASFAFGISKTNDVAAAVSYTPFSYTIGTTYLVVIKYTFNPSTADDSASLFINPVPGAAEPAPTVGPFTSALTDATSLTGIALRQGTGSSAPTVRVDGIRVATTFTEAASTPTSPPTVTSAAATSVGTTTATLNGNVTSDGNATISDRGFVYKTSAGATIADNKTAVAGTTGAYTLSPTLAVNTQYFFAAYAINSAGTTLSTPELNFWTLANVPTAPTVINPTNTTLDVAIGAGDGNPATTTYAIHETTGNLFVQAGGALGPAPVFQTAATWGTKTVTGLASGATFTFEVEARNGAAVTTTFGTSTNGTTNNPTAPAIVTSGTLSPFVSDFGTPSVEQSFTASGTNLTGDIVVTAPGSFEVSLVSGGTYTASLNLSPSSGTVPNTSIFVRLSGSAAVGTPSGNVTLTSPGATPGSVAATGTVRPLAPSTQATGAVVLGTATTTATVSWTRGNGANVLVVMKAGSAVSGAPVNSTAYVADPAFGNGAQIGTGNFVVYSGSGTSVPVTALAAGTAYFVAVYEFNGTGSNVTYNLGAPATANGITVPPAPGTPTFSLVTPSSFTATWAASTGAVDYRLDVATDIGFTTFVSGYNDLTVSGTSQSVTGLTALTQYFARVRAVNAAGTSANSGIRNGTTAGPTIASFAPLTGPVGTSVILTGSNLTGATAVAFNGTPAASFTVDSATQITAVVASGSTSGPVSATVAGATGTSTGSFTVTAPVLAGWDFQTTTSGGTAVLVAPATPLAYAANIGTGNLYLDGTNGSSTWVAATSGNEVTGFGGTAVNAGPGFSTSTTSPSSLALVGGAASGGGFLANGKAIVFKVNMTSQKDLTILYATQKSGATGFTTQTWAYSADGTTFTDFSAQSTLPASFGTIALPAVPALNNVATAYVRLTVTGATGASGNNRFDNVQFTATPVITPTLGTFTVPAKVVGDAPFPLTPPSSNSSGSFSYASSDPSVATISGATVTVVGVGSSIITATQAPSADGTYGTASATATLVVTMGTPITPTLGTFTVPGAVYGDAPFTLTPPSSDSPGSFSYQSSDPTVATVSGSTLTVVGVGTSTITANQAATTGYTSAATTASFVVSAKPLSVVANGQVKAKGQPDPIFTYSAGALVGSDTFSGSLSRVAGENPGLYSITLGSLSAGPNYSISFTGATLVITGPTPGNDAVSKPRLTAPVTIPVATLLGNDSRIDAAGTVQNNGLSVTAVASGPTNTVTLSGGSVHFTADGTSSVDTFTYTVSDGSTTATATVTVTLDLNAAPLALKVATKGVATFDGTNTSITVNFTGTPSQTFNVQYTTNLAPAGTWIGGTLVDSPANGTFSVIFTAAGDQTALWNTQMFYRATQ